MAGFEEGYGPVKEAATLSAFLREVAPKLQIVPLLEKDLVTVERAGKRSQATTADYALAAKDFVFVALDNPYQVDAAGRLDAFLETVEAPWRVPVLIAKGAVSVQRGIPHERVIDPKYALRPKDWVWIDPGAPGVQDALAKAASAAAKDYLFAPGSSAYEQDMARVLAARPDTTRITGIDDLATLFAGLRNWKNSEKFRTLAQTPLRTLLVVAHALNDGNLHVQLRRQRPDHKEDKMVTYESLIESIVNGELSVNRDALSPRPRDDKGNEIPSAFRIKGCLIGQHKIFLEQLKKALAPGIDRVTAPKFYNGADQFTKSGVSGGAPSGVYEYMLYEHAIRRPTKLLKRYELLKAFQTAGFKDYRGIDIDAKVWDPWIPRDERDLHKLDPQHPMQKPMVLLVPTSAGDVRVKFQNVQYEYSSFSVSGAVKVHPEPRAKSDIRKALLEGIPTLKPEYSDKYPFPFAVRLGYTDLNAMLDGLELETTYDKAAKKLAFKGVRHMYSIRPPVVDGDKLIVNFTPDDPKLKPTVMLEETDSKFYGWA